MLTSSAITATSATTPRPIIRYFIVLFQFDVMPNHTVERMAAGDSHSQIRMSLAAAIAHFRVMRRLRAR
jgi:hypothetical protein